MVFTHLQTVPSNTGSKVLTPHQHVLLRQIPFLLTISKIQKKKERYVYTAHLEEVILMYHTTVGQVLDQSVGEGGFPSIGHTARDKAMKRQ